MSKFKKISLIVAAVLLVMALAIWTVLISFPMSFRSNNLSFTQNKSVGYPSNSSLSSSPSGSAIDSAPRGFGEAGTFQSQADGNLSVPATQVDKKIIKNGDITAMVSDAEKAAGEIGNVAKKNGGEVFSSNFYQNVNNIKSGTIVVKIPVNNFEAVFAEIKKVVSLVVRESISGTDVTAQYVDLQSRLKNKQAEEEAFAKILERSGQIDDVLKVTKELSRVRGEIEVLQGQIKYLEFQTDMSTISVNVSEDENITISDSWRPLQITKDAVNSLVRKIQGFVNFAIVLLITVIPIALLYLLFVIIIYKIGKKVYLKIRGDKKVLPEKNNPTDLK